MVGGKFRASPNFISGDVVISGTVTVASDSSNYLLTPTSSGGGATTLDGLTDVSVAAPVSGNILAYNGANWIQSITSSGGGASSLSGLSDVAASVDSALSGAVMVYDGSSWQSSNSPRSASYVVVGAATERDAIPDQHEGMLAKVISEQATHELSGNLTTWFTSSLGRDKVELGEQVIPNQETPSIDQRVYQRFFTPSASTPSEDAAAMYFQPDHEAGTQRWAQIIEISASQVDATSGGAIKIPHFGQGDAIYCPMFNTSSAMLEAAAFHAQTKGVISTNQFIPHAGTLGSVAASKFINNTHFSSNWGWDTTGGSTVVSAFGAFYADRSLGHSFSVRVQNKEQPNVPGSPVDAGVVAGTPEFRIQDWVGRNVWYADNIGNTMQQSVTGTAASQTKDSPTLTLRGNHYNGGSNKELDAYFQHVVFGTDWSAVSTVIQGNLMSNFVYESGSFNYLSLNDNALIDVDWANSAPPPAVVHNIDNGFLSGTQFWFTHNLNQTYPVITLWDATGSVVAPGVPGRPSITKFTANLTFIEFSGLTPVTGTWRVAAYA